MTYYYTRTSSPDLAALELEILYSDLKDSYSYLR
jgi:hypothetical protein